VSERRPWLRAIGWIVLLGTFFFASYGFANSLASRRADVPSIVFGWERSIPFVPWTIIPYWSIDLLYGLSLLVCTTRREVDRQAQRLLAVQLICIAFFLAFPLRFSFDRPAVDGAAGALFAALGAFDKPFNQAPSLHIALLILIWARLDRHCPRGLRPIQHIWMLLIGGSVLTTWQHHFIDIPTGMIVGFIVLWALPDESASPLSGMALARDPARIRLALIYLTAAALVSMPAWIGGGWLWLFWASLSFTMVSLIYLAIDPRGFQKSSDGRISVAAAWLLAPYLAGAWVNSRLWTLRRPEPAEVADGVFIGRMPGRMEAGRLGVDAIVDLSAELPCVHRGDVSYSLVPVLDLTAPDANELRRAVGAIEAARPKGRVLVCCALGFSRSAAAVAAWLLLTRRAETGEAAEDIVRRARPMVVLRAPHRAALETLS